MNAGPMPTVCPAATGIPPLTRWCPVNNRAHQCSLAAGRYNHWTHRCACGYGWAEIDVAALAAMVSRDRPGSTG